MSTNSSSNNRDLERQLDTCNRQTALAQQAIQDHKNKIDTQLKIIEDAHKEKDRLIKMNYGNQIADLKSKFTNCTTPENKNASTTGCATWAQNGNSQGQNIYNKDGYYARAALKPLAACGRALAACRYSNFGQDCSNEINEGCRISATESGIYDPTYTAQNFSHFDNPENNSSNCAAAIAYCQKTNTTVDNENDKLNQLDQKIIDAQNTIARLGANTISLQCDICAQINTISCGTGSVCSDNQQVSNCASTIEQVQKIYNQCKAKGGIYNKDKNSCSVKLDSSSSSKSKTINMKKFITILIIFIFIICVIIGMLYYLKRYEYSNFIDFLKNYRPYIR